MPNNTSISINNTSMLFKPNTITSSTTLFALFTNLWSLLLLKTITKLPVSPFLPRGLQHDTPSRHTTCSALCLHTLIHPLVFAMQTCQMVGLSCLARLWVC